MHTNTLIIGNNNIKEGIILNISYLPKYVGLYFYCQYKNAEVPIIDRFGVANKNLSFYPFNISQQEFAISILDFINISYKDFDLFNNLYASVEIENIVIHHEVKNKTNLFQAIFEDNMYTLF